MVSIQKGSGIFDYRRNPDVKSILPSLGEKIQNFSDTSRHSISSGLVNIYRYSTHSHGWCVRYSNMGATSFLADWRWFTRESHYPDTSPWYNQCYILPSKKPANWGEVVERVAVDLKKLSSPLKSNDSFVHYFLDNIVPMSYYMYSDDEQEVQMIGVEVTGGLKKDRELADEIVWWCMDMLMPRHRNLDVTVKLTKTFEDGAQGFCYQGDDDRDFTIEIDHRLVCHF